MTTHRRPQGPGGEFDEAPSEGFDANEDLSSREETTEPSTVDGSNAGSWPLAADPQTMTDDELEVHVIDTARAMNVLEAQLATAVAEVDRRRLAEERHVLTTKQWLRHTCRMAASRASAVLAMGRALVQMPTTAAIARSGAITANGLRMLTAAHNDHPHAFPRHEAVLADAATHLGPRDLRAAIGHWEQQVAYPETIEAIESRKRRRRLSVAQSWDGMWALSGSLDPESGHAVDTALRARMGSAATDPSDRRSYGQRAADALVDICRFSLDHDDAIETSGGTKPHITATVDVGSLCDATDDAPSDRSGGRPPLPTVDGEPITPEDARRLACDAGITRMVTSGPSQVLDVGRTTRSIPSATRRAVEHRDGGCAWTGCDAHISWCDVHHIVHWAHGGRTDVDNLMLVCRRHHSALHEGRSPP